MSKKYLIYWKPNATAKGQPSYDVIECDSIEGAFLETVRLKQYGTEIRVFQEVKLKVELKEGHE